MKRIFIFFVALAVASCGLKDNVEAKREIYALKGIAAAIYSCQANNNKYCTAVTLNEAYKCPVYTKPVPLCSFANCLGRCSYSTIFSSTTDYWYFDKAGPTMLEQQQKGKADCESNGISHKWTNTCV